MLGLKNNRGGGDNNSKQLRAKTYDHDLLGGGVKADDDDGNDSDENFMKQLMGRSPKVLVKHQIKKQNFKNDLAFLNELEPKEIANLSSMFRSEGRQAVRKAIKEQYKGSCRPTMGSY